ncbi:transposase [Rhizobium sp. BE258]|uniref:transposase n=1 Tax=Rhizobium sp. BE258 TaxID=2817722 RepID=UPI00285F35A5|nr:transposase [Rhizobium sp. BE258]MDR7145209.1 transposase-like protein [Rhizobium sp. BE258]
MAKHPIEVITSVERRRRWSREDKERLVAYCCAPDAVISEIARAADIHVSQLSVGAKSFAGSSSHGLTRRLWCL